jgi:hypothetical protein
MATQIIDLTGTIKWAKLSKKNMDTKFEPAYKLDFYPDAASKAILRASGSRVTAKENEDGVYYSFKRDAVRTRKDPGTGETYTEDDVPPTVGTDLDEAGNLIQMHNPESVGNGTRAVVRLAVYDSAYGKGTRLEAVKITELAIYEGTPFNGARTYKF